MFFWPNCYLVHPYTLSELCASVCVCRGFSLSLSLPARVKIHHAKAYKVSPTLSLIMKSLIWAEFQKITWIYRNSIWLQQCAKGELQAVYQRATWGHSHNLSSYLLNFFFLAFTSRIKLGRNKRQPGVLLCSVKPEILSINVSVLEKTWEKWQYLQNHLKLLRLSFAEIN